MLFLVLTSLLCVTVILIRYLMWRMSLRRQHLILAVLSVKFEEREEKVKEKGKVRDLNVKIGHLKDTLQKN